ESMSSTVLTASERAASALVTATAATPDADPSRPVSTVPDPWGDNPAANRATVAPRLPASSPSGPPVTISAVSAASTGPLYLMNPVSRSATSTVSRSAAATGGTAGSR